MKQQVIRVPRLAINVINSGHNQFVENQVEYYLLRERITTVMKRTIYFIDWRYPCHSNDFLSIQSSPVLVAQKVSAGQMSHEIICDKFASNERIGS